MSFSLAVVCMLRLSSGSVEAVYGLEVKELSQDVSIVYFEALNAAKRVNMNSCLYVDGSKVEAVYRQQIGPQIQKLNK